MTKSKTFFQSIGAMSKLIIWRCSTPFFTWLKMDVYLSHLSFSVDPANNRPFSEGKQGNGAKKTKCRQYKRRNEVKRFFRRIKEYRRVFTRYDKLDCMYSTFLLFSVCYEILRLYVWTRSKTKKTCQTPQKSTSFIAYAKNGATRHYLFYRFGHYCPIKNPVKMGFW